jgi:NAD(P)-dependent dehydrogenase (short-subunit alcohol dehydrogenase family)
MSEPSLRGRRVLITGGSSGIGLATAALFAREGASLALIARGRDGLDAAADRLRDHGATVATFAADVADRAALEDAVNAAVATLGGLDVAVTGAAALSYGPFTDLPPGDVDRVLAVTFGGTVNTIRAAMPALERSGGTIVAIGSIAGRVPTPMQAPYTAAKHAVRGFAGALRAELRHAGSPVTISLVAPAPIDTPLWNATASVTGTRPRPLRPTYSPESVADTIVACARRPRAEVTVGGSSVLLGALFAAARPAVDRILATYGIAGQQGGPPVDGPGALREPSGAGRVRDGHRGRGSLFTALRTRRLRPSLPRDAGAGPRSAP